MKMMRNDDWSRSRSILMSTHVPINERNEYQTGLNRHTNRYRKSTREQVRDYFLRFSPLDLRDGKRWKRILVSGCRLSKAASFKARDDKTIIVPLILSFVFNLHLNRRAACG